MPDADYRNVLVAAIQAKANIIVTDNSRDFPASMLTPHGIVALTADQALCRLFDQEPDLMLEAAKSMRARMVKPPVSPKEWLDRLVTSGAPDLAARLGARPGRF